MVNKIFFVIFFLFILVLHGYAQTENGRDPHAAFIFNFEENAGALTTDSVTLNQGTITGATWAQPAGAIGKCLYFDGASRVDAVNHAKYNLTSMTLNFCIYGTAASWGAYNTIAINGKADSVTVSNFWLDTGAAGQARFNFQDTPGNFKAGLSMTSTLPVQKSTMITVTFNAITKLMVFYINGDFDSSGVSNGVPGYTNQPLMIGRAFANGSYQYYFTGYVELAGGWDTDYSAGQVKALYKYESGKEGRCLQSR